MINLFIFAVICIITGCFIAVNQYPRKFKKRNRLK